ncbi:MAG: site-specific integrase [Bacteroidetes bacterium]|nr:site-specific integrase [Bacteroidota bacterium]
MFLSKVGDIYYLFFTDESGIRHKVTTKCRNKSGALEFLNNFRRERYEKRKRTRALKLSDFTQEFVEYSKGVHSIKTQKTNLTAFKEFLRIEGDMSLHSFGIKEIEHFLGIKKREASEWTARKYYGCLAAAFEKAVQWDYIEENPFRRVKKPKGREIIPAFFTKGDFSLFLSVIDKQEFKDLCITALLSGLRLAELISLRWIDIDFTTKVIVVCNSDSFTTKSRKNRVVPLNEELFKLLKEREERKEKGFSTVFCNQYGEKLKEHTISHQFKKYLRKAGLNEKLHFHSLRHSFASWLAQNGTSIYVIKDLLGHSDVKTTQIYSHLQPENLHVEVNKISINLN